MIPRHQIVLFFVLLAASLTLGGLLWHLRERTHQRLLAGQDSTPTHAPLVAPLERATLMVAQDADDSLRAQVLSLPLPPEPSSRARAILAKLLELYAAPDATHPVPGGAGSIAQVFLLPIEAGSAKPEATTPQVSGPSGNGANIGSDIGANVRANIGTNVSSGTAQAGADTQTGPELAVVNLTGSFAASHPSGLETETLTVLSICATLHANLPRITEVRFLVDGEPRATLAGHADLTRTYLTGDTVTTEGAQP